VLIIWWSFGLKLPNVALWLSSVRDTVTEVVTTTVTTTVMPAVPTQLRELVT